MKRIRAGKKGGKQKRNSIIHSRDKLAEIPYKACYAPGKDRDLLSKTESEAHPPLDYVPFFPKFV